MAYLVEHLFCVRELVGSIPGQVGGSYWLSRLLLSLELSTCLQPYSRVFAILYVCQIIICIKILIFFFFFFFFFFLIFFFSSPDPLGSWVSLIV